MIRVAEIPKEVLEQVFSPKTYFCYGLVIALIVGLLIYYILSKSKKR